MGTILLFPGIAGIVAYTRHGRIGTREGTGRAGEESAWDQVVLLLHRTRERTSPSVAELVPLIVPHVEEELSRVLRLLLEREAPPLADEKPLRLSQAQEMLIEGAIQRLPRAKVVGALEALLQGRQGPSVRRVRIQVEGCVGSSEELGAIFELSLREDEYELSPELEAKLRDAIARIVTRDARRACDWLLRCWRKLPEPVHETIVLALGDADHPLGLEVLLSIAEWREELAIVAIAQVRSIGPSPDDDVNARLLDVVHRHVDLERPGPCQTLVLAMGELCDFESIPFLLDLLQAEHEGLAKSALWALQRMSAMKLAASAALWRHWYARELAWAEEERDLAIERLATGSRAEAVAAVKEIAEHRYERHRLASVLAAALEHPDAEVRLAVCRGLPALASPRADEALQLARHDPDARVAAAAACALQNAGSAEASSSGLAASSER